MRDKSRARNALWMSFTISESNSRYFVSFPYCSIVLKAQHGDIVKLLCTGNKSVDALHDVGKDCLWFSARITIQGIQRALRPKQFVLGVGGFRDAVRIDEQAVARVEMEAVLP